MTEETPACGTFTAELGDALTLRFTDVETLGRMTVILEGDTVHILAHIRQLFEQVIERALGGLEEHP